MKIDVTIKIGGEAGQGIQTVGDLLAQIGHQTGLYITVVNDFESRIRGGNSFVQLRISNQPIAAPSDQVHILAAFNQSILELDGNDMVDGGLVLTDGEEKATSSELSFPFTEMAKAAGGKIMTNTVVAGAILGLLGAPFKLFESLLSARFETKGQQILDNNLKAAKAGYDSVSQIEFKWSFDWEKKDPVGLLIGGNKAVALGAVAADCRFSAFYPMSPATGIITELTDLTQDFPLVIEQVEDEIAAVNMVMGAAYAGVRSITTTSGGGFSLMVEGLGLAGIAEIPIVIVNAQRPGPATGLPTRTAQPDLLFTIFASQDEFPRFIFAPGTPAEAFDLTIKAFHLADKYQVPVVILMDQYLNDSLFTIDKPLSPPDKIDRFITTDADLDDPAAYERYQFTDSGVSPRVLPCQGEALCVASGNEHTPDGHISEDALNRVKMMDKRMAKLEGMKNEIAKPSVYNEKAKTLLVSWGSTFGAVKEAMDMLKTKGVDVGCVHLSEIWPFPVEQITDILNQSDRFIMVEQNTSAQLGRVIREQTGLLFEGTVLKYDGRPFDAAEIVNHVNQLLG